MAQSGCVGRRDGAAAVPRVLGEGCSTAVDPDGCSARSRLCARWHSVRGAVQSRAGLAPGRVGRECHWLRVSYRARALSAAELTGLGSLACGPCSGAWSLRACGWRKHPFTVDRIDQPAPTASAPRARDLARYYGAPGVSGRARHKRRARARVPERPTRR